MDLAARPSAPLLVLPWLVARQIQLPVALLPRSEHWRRARSVEDLSVGVEFQEHHRQRPQPPLLPQPPCRARDQRQAARNRLDLHPETARAERAQD